MKLSVSYDPDPEVDVLNIVIARRNWGGWSLASNSNIIVEVGEQDAQDVVGILMIFASYKVAPYFRVAGEQEPRWMGREGFVRYDPATDTLTWGVTTDAPGMVSQADDITVYWQPAEPNREGITPIGVSLLNAEQHLAPHFERVELPGGGG